jgi:hypothetical protein
MVSSTQRAKICVFRQTCNPPINIYIGVWFAFEMASFCFPIEIDLVSVSEFLFNRFLSSFDLFECNIVLAEKTIFTFQALAVHVQCGVDIDIWQGSDKINCWVSIFRLSLGLQYNCTCNELLDFVQEMWIISFLF